MLLLSPVLARRRRELGGLVNCRDQFQRGIRAPAPVVCASGASMGAVVGVAGVMMTSQVSRARWKWLSTRARMRCRHTHTHACGQCQPVSTCILTTSRTRAAAILRGGVTRPSKAASCRMLHAELAPLVAVAPPRSPILTCACS